MKVGMMNKDEKPREGRSQKIPEYKMEQHSVSVTIYNEMFMKEALYDDN